MASCSGQNIWRKVLDESLLADLIAGLDKGFSKTKWRDLGLRLGLKKQSLEEIAYNYRDDISMCLTECLSNWLKKQDDVDSRGGPTLNSLIDALKRIGENAVAEKMSTKEQLALLIIQHHCLQLQNSPLQVHNPKKLAELLCNEGIISKEVLAACNDQHLSKSAILALLSSVKDAIEKDYTKLQKLGELLKCTEETFHDDDCHTTKQGLSLSLPCHLASDFAKLKIMFGRMFNKVRVAIINTCSVTLENLKQFLSDCYLCLQPQLHAISEINAVLTLVRQQCVNVIDIHILREIIEQFDIKEAYVHIEKYEEFMKEFCKQIEIKLFLKERFSEKSLPLDPLKFATVTFVLDWKPNDRHTLDDIKNILSVACNDIYTQGCLNIEVIEEGNSIDVICTIPLCHKEDLILQVLQNVERLKICRDLLLVSIGNTTVYTREVDATSGSKGAGTIPSVGSPVIKQPRSSDTVHEEVEVHVSTPTASLTTGTGSKRTNTFPSIGSPVTKQPRCSDIPTFFDSKKRCIHAISGIDNPNGIAVTKDHIFVTQNEDNKLTVFDKKSEKFIKHINIPLCEPRGLAVTPDNYIIVADDHKIRKIDIDGKCIASVGKYGDKEGEFKHVGCITISPDNQYLYVTDYKNHRIQILDASDFSFKAFIGNETPKPRLPTHTAIDGKTLYVCSSGRHCIVQYTLHDNLHAECYQMFGNDHLYQGEHSMEEEDYQPFRMAIREGILYVTDHINNRIVMFTSDGKYVGYYAGEDLDLFNCPVGISFDSTGDKLYVCDQGNNRIVVIY